MRDAAQMIAEQRRTPAPESPADTLPDHYSELLSELRTIREDTETAKLGGSRVPRVLIVGENIKASTLLTPSCEREYTGQGFIEM